MAQIATAVNATELPLNWKVITPAIVTTTPTPANEATAIFIAEEAAAIAYLRGTPTPPIPGSVWTATPTLTPTPTSTPFYILATHTPIPENVLTALPVAEIATVSAATFGTPTPLPDNWNVIAPAIVSITPSPANAATATFVAEVATAQAYLYGTPVPPPPSSVWTATPVPLLIPVEQIDDSSSLPSLPASAYNGIPEPLKGKIIFKSDRLGGKDLFIMNPDGSQVSYLTTDWVYDIVFEQNTLSGNEQFQVIVSDKYGSPQLFVLRRSDGAQQQLTYMTHSSYHAAWSPASETIAFVTQDSGNDEIFLINSDGSGLTRITFNDWEWDKHPSWSPDGSQIVFWSNRESTRQQIWLMNADGSEPRNLSNNEFNDWDPIWIR